MAAGFVEVEAAVVEGVALVGAAAAGAELPASSAVAAASWLRLPSTSPRHFPIASPR